MHPFSYQRPQDAAGAIAAFTAAGAGAHFTAGGTTLYDLLKLNVEHPRHLIDVTATRSSPDQPAREGVDNDRSAIWIPTESMNARLASTDQSGILLPDGSPPRSASCSAEKSGTK